jgi:hypothetical protein
MAMTFKSRIWQPIAIVVSAANLVSVGFAAAAAQSWHAGVHAGLALVFGLWAQRLRQREGVGALALTAGGSELQAGLEALEIEVSDLRRDLGEAQERLDFTERMLTQVSESRRPADK